MVDAIELVLVPRSSDRSEAYLTNVQKRFTSLPYLQRYHLPTTQLATHALFVSSTSFDPALALHLLVVEGNTSLVDEWLHYNPALVTSATLELAAAASQGSILRQLFERYPERATPKMMDLVAMAGDSTLLRWLHEAGANCTTAAMDGAAMNGHLDVVAFLHKTRTEGCTMTAPTAAVANGHAAIVAFLFHHRTEPVESWLLYRSPYDDIKTYCVDGAQYLDAIDLAVTRTRLVESSLQPILQCMGLPALSHFHHRGYLEVTARTLVLAVTMRDHAMLRYVLDVVDKSVVTKTSAWASCDAMDIAAFDGDVAALELLQASRIRWKPTRALANAAYNGHLDVLQWLRSFQRAHLPRGAGGLLGRGNGDYVTGRAADWAAHEGHLDILVLLVTHGHRLSPTAIDKAVVQGHAPVVSHLRSVHGQRWSSLALSHAITNCHLHVVADLTGYESPHKAMGCRDAAEMLFENATKTGSVAILKLVTQAYPLRTPLNPLLAERCMVHATLSGHFEMVCHLHKAYGVACTPAVQGAAEQMRRKSVLQYLATGSMQRASSLFSL
ncbi:hypothetical protein SDRG_12500 [Saprolegnia diclina VS20]|uniref:Ankyrin repeat domain-containing protein n=1 Tax=Saprolegnia diclina (strain VS20) TaxID=1156394 RepID=T0RBZ2_SAPDV|nr:hypothetical protein SDRG_12500 [Saprolegnia diclina VS20]EQC29728.1 hypothetical protein SDRG_12500 [Saprolegnia diclina VS20]|eukprot:XP_008616794.1 hypothetical protein SDRG_12500 [Saprolegnia diclina VS20]